MLLTRQPCDEEYKQEDYMQECSRQDIASSYTVFSWEASYDGAAHFVHLSLDTALTSARAQVLEEVYLRGVTHVRCSIEAVSSAHTLGTWRTSLPFDLAHSLKPACAADQPLLSALASLTSYPAFSNSSRVRIEPSFFFFVQIINNHCCYPFLTPIRLIFVLYTGHGLPV